jgi:cystathionine gamma-lyase
MRNGNTMKSATRAVHAGLPDIMQGKPFLPGPTFAGAYHFTGDPAYPTASRQMNFFGPVVSFELGGRVLAENFLNSCALVFEATSFGGLHSTAERRARWGGD